MAWKIYFWIITLIIVGGTGLYMAESLGILLPDEEGPIFEEPWTWLDWLDTFITGICLVGLFGFAYKKAIGEQRFWKQWFVFIIIFDTAYTVYEYNIGVYNTEEMWRPEITFPILIALGIPFYIALYLYGYKSNALWNPKPTTPQ